MESHKDADTAQRIVETVSAARALTPYIACYEAKHKDKAVTPPPDTPRRGVFFQDDLSELNNIISLFLFTCLNPSHIRASCCIDVDGIAPLILISTNQGAHEENAQSLGCCAETIQSICRLLATITADSVLAVRDQILGIVTRDAWHKISHKFGLTYHNKCTTKFDKDIKTPAYLPCRLKKISKDIAKKTGSTHADLIRAMGDLAQLLRHCFDREAKRDDDKQPEEANGAPGDKVKALLATHTFYHTHGEHLSEVLQPNSENDMAGKDSDFIKRFKNLAQYVEAVHFLCNLALGKTQSGRQTTPPSANADNGRISAWFASVDVDTYQLPKEAFFRNGHEHPQLRGVPSPPTPPTSPSELTPSDTPDAPASPTASASSVASSSHTPTSSHTACLTTLRAVMGKLKLEHLYDSRPWPPPPCTGKGDTVQKEKTDFAKACDIASQKEKTDFTKAYDSACGCGGKPLPKIHAEVALLCAIAELVVKYPAQLGGTAAPPIYIASFKKACYCCRIFTRASGMNVVLPQSHPNIYSSWCLPDHQYLCTSVPSAAHWPGEFCDAIRRTLEAALQKTANDGGQAGERASSEDLELHTFATIDRDAYSSDHWTAVAPALRATPAPAPAPSSPNVADAEGPDPARQKRPSGPSKKNSHCRRKIPKHH